MTPRQRVLKRVDECRAEIEATIELYYERVKREPHYLDMSWVAMKRDDLAALRYLVRKARQA